ncbi:hypothetical protein B6D60_11320 [candidate division KSB1 bacterium 4484_87]|nr:MAG: hypothetical protein B6D60_11320 [candidate division KSB1 bacterium 4484_87]
MKINRGLLYLFAVGLFFSCAAPQKFSQKNEQAALGKGQPFNPRAVQYFIRGTVANMLNDTESALINFQQALLYDSTSVTIYKNMADQYLGMKEFDSARRVLEQAAARFPNDIEVHYTLASIYYSQHNLEAAERQYEKILELAPDEFDARNYLITLYLTEKKLQQVAQQYELIYEMGHDNPTLTHALKSCAIFILVANSGIKPLN